MFGDPRHRTEDIRAADPLGADALLAAVPAMNARADTAALTVALRALVPDQDRAAQWSVAGALAAMRDLGILLGSLKRHGIQPLAAVPEALPVLELRPPDGHGAPGHRPPLHDLEPARAAPPLVHRPSDRSAQEAVRMVFPGLVAAIEDCSRVARLEPYDPGSASALDRVARHVKTMVGSIDLTGSGRSRPVLRGRPCGRTSRRSRWWSATDPGLAAATIPFWLVDLTLWQCDRSDDAYDAFLAESLPYALPGWREFHARHRGGVSAVSKLSAAVSWERMDRLPPELVDGGRARPGAADPQDLPGPTPRPRPQGVQRRPAAVRGGQRRRPRRAAPLDPGPDQGERDHGAPRGRAAPSRWGPVGPAAA
ncbi:monodechloroaminopyrrolnitrin synthase PrnB family protein [Streptomyces narbonensis]